MIYDTSDPYGNLFSEDTHEHATNEEINEDEILDEDCKDCNKKEGTSVSDILDKKEDIKKYSNLIAYGVIGVIGLMILKRYM
jgi:hypothetical protein